MKFQNMITLEWVEAQDWQMALNPGDCYVNEHPMTGTISRSDATREQGFTAAQLLFGALEYSTTIKIYCQVLSEAKEIGPGFLWVRAYSEFEPRGERGLNCIVDGTRPITKLEFEQAIQALRRIES